VAFAGGSVFLIDADRGDTFFAVFLLVVRAFLALFLRVAALDTGAFLLFFPLALPLAFLLVAITASSMLTCMIVAE
jgi:hypothetical protein